VLLIKIRNWNETFFSYGVKSSISFCNDSCFFSNVQIFFKRYFTIYVILDFTSYEKNVSFQYLIFINNTLKNICTFEKKP
jgi:hypothetical protein